MTGLKQMWLVTVGAELHFLHDPTEDVSLGGTTSHPKISHRASSADNITTTAQMIGQDRPSSR